MWIMKNSDIIAGYRYLLVSGLWNSSFCIFWYRILIGYHTNVSVWVGAQDDVFYAPSLLRKDIHFRVNVYFICG